MNAKQKQTLYNLFDKTCEAILGFSSPNKNYPSFTDDVEMVNEHGFNEFTSLNEIYNAVSKCKLCCLCNTRKKTVVGEGPAELSGSNKNIDVMVIGEAPGAEEDRQGRPFVGKAGELLDKMLAAIYLSRNENCYIANVIKCRPPQNRDPVFEEISACSIYLNCQIKLLQPKAILVVGRIALQHLLKTSEGIGRLHGKFFEYQNIPLMATYHPSALLRNETLKRPAWEDLKLFRKKLDELKPNKF